MWQRHMNSSGLSQEDEKETEWFAAGSIARWDFSTPLALLDIDQLDAKAVSAKCSRRWHPKSTLYSATA